MTSRLGKKYPPEALPVFRVWSEMKSRCLNPNRPNYKWYGGAGVTIHPRWMKFENFWNDIGPRPSATHQLDKDSIKPGNKVYGPGLCQWVTKERNMDHTRRRCEVVHQGKSYSLRDLEQVTGFPIKMLRSRWNKGLRSYEELTAPRQRKRSPKIDLMEVSYGC